VSEIPQPLGLDEPNILWQQLRNLSDVFPAIYVLPEDDFDE
jgi:hypothetical protein